MPDAVKLSDSTFKVITQGPTPAPIEQEYSYDFLIEQKARIIKDANSYVAARQAELDHVNDLLAQAEAIGIGAAIMPEPIGETETPIGG
jgi:hypothetical protein